METIDQILIHWFNQNKRDLPWRSQRNWYTTFLSEFLLQQTQVNQALPYFEKFFQRFPTIHHLAKANEDEILTLWSGLGYYNRARNLLKTAKQIVEKFNGQFPENISTALQLPGIGPYTASAILSLAFKQAHPVVDGNVLRVIARLFAIEHDIRQQTTKKVIQNKVRALIPPQKADLFNESLMEFGALICKPKAPHCLQCPLQKHCQSFLNNKVELIPYKSPAARKKKIFQLVFVVRYKNRVLIAQRKTKGLLAKMWEFPIYEDNELTLAKMNVQQILKKYFSDSWQMYSRALPPLKHNYSHITLQYQPLLVHSKKPFRPKLSQYLQIEWLPLEAIEQKALHKAHQKILKQEEFKKWWADLNN